MGRAKKRDVWVSGQGEGHTEASTTGCSATVRLVGVGVWMRIVAAEARLGVLGFEVGGGDVGGVAVAVACHVVC